MTEQTTTPAPVAPDTASSPALPPAARGDGISSPPPGFGGRTDAHVGMDLGLAPPGLGSAQRADASAPESLLRREAGMDVARVLRQQSAGLKANPPKEHPFKTLMRDAAQKRAAADAAAAAPAASEIIDAEFAESSVA
jgi:hypothetical protein